MHNIIMQYYLATFNHYYIYTPFKYILLIPH